MLHYGHALASALSKHSNVTLLVGNEAALPPSTGFQLLKMQVNGSRGAVLRGTLSMRRLLRRGSWSVVHITNAWYLNPLLLHGVDGLRITTIHDVRTHLGERTIGNVLTYAWHRRSGDSWIVHGERSARILRKGRPSRRVFVVPHGSFSHLTSGDAAYKGNERVALFFGRIVAYKGLKTFVEAVRMVRADGCDVTGVIAGGGHLDPHTLEAVSSGGFELLNEYVPDHQITALFTRAMVVVCPYVEATQSGVISLAYAHNRPVIATDVGDIPDVVLEDVTGYLVPPGDAAAIAKHLKRLHEYPELAMRLAAGARAFAETRLDWATIARQTLSVYQMARDT